MNDGSEVVTIIRIGMETQYYLIKGVVKSILQLIQFMKKMEKTGILKGKEMNNFNAFIKKTEGQFQLLNIPTEQPEELEGMRKNFEKLLLFTFVKLEYLVYFCRVKLRHYHRFAAI